MTLLNRASNGHVASMVALWRSLSVLGPTPRDEFLAICSHRLPSASPLSITISTWRGLGFLEAGQEELLAIAPQFASIAQSDIDGLRTAILGLLMKPENVPALLGVEGDEAATRASDFVRVAAFSLAQDPYELASVTSDNAALEKGRGQGLGELWQGTGRWSSFQEWAYFCGLGMPTPRGFLMNPARAIREALRSLAAERHWIPGTEMTLEELLRLLAAEVPLLEAGTYRRQIDERLGRQGEFVERKRISPSTSLAFLQLAHEREIVFLDQAGDVSTRHTLTGWRHRPLVSYSHVRIGTPRVAKTDGGGQA